MVHSQVLCNTLCMALILYGICLVPAIALKHKRLVQQYTWTYIPLKYQCIVSAVCITKLLLGGSRQLTLAQWAGARQTQAEMCTLHIGPALVLPGPAHQRQGQSVFHQPGPRQDSRCNSRWGQWGLINVVHKLEGHWG